MLLGVPTSLRGDDPTGQSQNSETDQFDTSHRNSYTGNIMGIRPDGTRDPNGTDFWWDEGGIGNCWSGNQAAAGRKITGSPTSLPACPKGSNAPAPSFVKLALNAPCATWDPQTNTDPPGCDWMTLPPEPK